MKCAQSKFTRIIKADANDVDRSDAVKWTVCVCVCLLNAVVAFHAMSLGMVSALLFVVLTNSNKPLISIVSIFQSNFNMFENDWISAVWNPAAIFRYLCSARYSHWKWNADENFMKEKKKMKKKKRVFILKVNREKKYSHKTNSTFVNNKFNLINWTINDLRAWIDLSLSFGITWNWISSKSKSNVRASQ